MSNDTQKPNETKEQPASEDSCNSQSKFVGLIGSSLAAAFLIVISIILVVALVQCWPSSDLSKDIPIITVFIMNVYQDCRSRHMHLISS